MTHTGPDRETVRRAVAMAVRAPSVHNTQPWRWALGEGTVHLYVDHGRRVPVTDPDGRDLVISCGAALHHLRVAAAALGWTGVVHRIPNPDDPNHLAAFELLYQHEPDSEDIALAGALQQRRTDRRRFSSWPVLPEHLDLLVATAAREGAMAVAVTDPAARFALAGAIAQAAVVQESDPAYAVEMAIWSGRGTGTTDGVLASSVPSTEREDDVRQRTFAHATLNQPRGKRYGEESAMLLISTSSDDLLSRLRAGEATSAALLAATRIGLAACPMSQPLEIADTRRIIRDDLLGGSAIPQLLVRLGWAPTSAQPLPRSPRRDVEDVLDELPL